MIVLRERRKPLLLLASRSSAIGRQITGVGRARFVTLLFALLCGDLGAGAVWGSMEAGRNLTDGSRTAARLNIALTVQTFNQLTNDQLS